MSVQYRQGDVLLRRIPEMPSRLQFVDFDRGRVVLAYGEETGHAHAFAEDARILQFRDPVSRLAFLRVGHGGAELCHEEHNPILVLEGKYEVLRQREYTEEMIRPVLD